MPSTVIRAIGYEAESGTLLVTFVDGDVYAYPDVPERDYHAFKGAFSKGRWFGRHIRPRFTGKRIRRGED